MGKTTELFLDIIRELGKEKIKKWIGFDEWIKELKQNEKLNIDIENHLSQNQTQSLVNNNGVSYEIYIAELEANKELKSELADCKNIGKKIKITKSEHRIYMEILKHKYSPFFPQNLIADYDIFAKLRYKGIVKNSKNSDEMFEVVAFEKDLEIVEDNESTK